MTKIRFSLNIVIVLLFFVLFAFTSGNKILLYADLLSLIMVVFIPLIVISMVYPFSEQKRFLNAVFERSPADQTDQFILKKTVEYLKSYKRILIYNAVIWTIMGGVGIGAHLEGSEALGLNFGVLMIVPLYTVLFLLTIIEPLRATAQNKID